MAVGAKGAACELSCGDEAGRLSSVEEAAGEFASGDGASCRLSSAGSVGDFDDEEAAGSGDFVDDDGDFCCLFRFKLFRRLKTLRCDSIGAKWR